MGEQCPCGVIKWVSPIIFGFAIVEEVLRYNLKAEGQRKVTVGGRKIEVDQIISTGDHAIVGKSSVCPTTLMVTIITDWRQADIDGEDDILTGYWM
jgi:hypothetical protein